MRDQGGRRALAGGIYAVGQEEEEEEEEEESCDILLLPPWFSWRVVNKSKNIIK